MTSTDRQGGYKEKEAIQRPLHNLIVRLDTGAVEILTP